jgi:hypothetical protein
MLEGFRLVTDCGGRLTDGRPDEGGGARRAAFARQRMRALQLTRARQPAQRVLGIGLVFVLGACTLPGPVASKLPVVTPTDPVLAFVATGPLGAPGNVAAPAYGGIVTVDIKSQYYAASGDTCRTYDVSAPGGGPRDALACKDGSGWQNVAPLLDGPSGGASP